ncbi:MAG: hypothetical protein K0R21_630 [Anaerocolumna sp.]|jgi:putative Mn2+ efflux pump MntP|nr:hypothetical protein [Anaerocolumna sp.]
MNLFELLLIAVGVSMDAFAVAICKGLSMPKVTVKKAGTVGLYFGVFQAGMPLIGYILGVQFRDIISSVDHWVAFLLLSIIGVSMIKESLENEACPTDNLDFKSMVTLSLSTSVDALAVGVTFAFLNVSILPAVTFIGLITFSITIAGVIVGNIFGTRFKSKAELVGGLVLIGMGIKILFEHLGFITF